MLQAEATRLQKTRGWRDVEREGFSLGCLRFVSLLFVCLLSPEGLSVVPGRACHMLPWGARVTCYPWDARCSGYGSNLADWLTSSWLKVIGATRTVHAKVMMRLPAGCPLFWLRVEPG